MTAWNDDVAKQELFEALAWASAGGHLIVVQKLLYDPCIYPASYVRAIKTAACHDRFNVLEWLLHDGRINCVAQEDDAIHSHLASVKQLVSRVDSSSEKQRADRVLRACEHLDVVETLFN